MRRPEPGDIYIVADEILTFGEAHEPHRQGRRFVVLSNDDAWRIVVGCPLSSSTQQRSKLCVRLAAGESGCIKKTWIRIPAIQPIAKRDLGNYVGQLSEDRLRETRTRVAQLVGLV